MRQQQEPHYAYSQDARTVASRYKPAHLTYLTYTHTNDNDNDCAEYAAFVCARARAPAC